MRTRPTWLVDAGRYTVAVTAVATLLVAINSQMLGLARLAYSLATNRQIPSAVGRLSALRGTPYVAIVIATVIAFGLAVPHDLEFLVGTFAFGAMIAFSIAHLSLIVLRFREPARPSAFRVPLSVPVRGALVPLPSVFGLVLAVGMWISVVALHEGARIAGSIWMVAGIVLYVVYRRAGGKPLRQRFTIPAAALQERDTAEYGSILVPVFGEELDDEIVGTAGRLAAEHDEDGGGGAVLEALYVFEIPMSLPIDARVSEDRVRDAKAVLARAKEVGEEYDGVEVATAMVRGRTVGQAIVSEARRRGVEAIVLAAEEPTRVRGGAVLGGRGRIRDRFVGDTTRYVIEKAPCRVILTAPARGRGGHPRGCPAVECEHRMFVLIVGCGRVGSSIAHSMLLEGHEVSVLDEDAEAIALLDRDADASWEERGGRFTEGTALEIDALLAAGIEQADAFVASTDGDNTNLVIAQIAKRRFNIERVVVRVLDPARARWYAEQGLQTVCPTQTAIELLEAAVRGQIRFEGVSG